MRSLLGKSTLTILWDFKKFFDSLDIDVLVEEALAVDFPMMELALSLQIHLAPRRLKMGTAIGDAVTELGGSILAGCKRSTGFARTYTLRFVIGLARRFRQVSLYQHVDDMTNLCKPTFNNNLVTLALQYAMAFKEGVDKLRLTISDKTTVVPLNDDTKRLCRIANRANIPMKAAAGGVDIGVDSSSGTRRVTAKQKERLRESGKKS